MSDAGEREDATPAPRKLNWIERGHLAALLKFREKPPGNGLLLVRAVQLSLAVLSSAAAVGVLFGFGVGLLLRHEYGPSVESPLPVAVGIASACGIAFGLVYRDLQEVRSFVVSWPLFRRLIDFERAKRWLDGGVRADSGADAEARRSASVREERVS